MFDDILALVKEHMGSNPGATPEQTDAMHHEIATHIHDELQNRPTAPVESGGILSQLENSLAGGNVLTGAVAGGLISSLAGKFGLSSAVTGALAGALPGLVQKFMQQHNSAPQAGAMPA